MSLTIPDIYIQPFGPTGSDGITHIGGIQAYIANIPSAADWKTLAHNVNYLNSCATTPVPYSNWLSGSGVSRDFNAPGYFDTIGDPQVLLWEFPIANKSNVTTRQIWGALDQFARARSLDYSQQLIFQDGQTIHMCSGGAGRGGEADGSDSPSAAGAPALAHRQAIGQGLFYVSQSVAASNVIFMQVTGSLTYLNTFITSSRTITQGMACLGIQDYPRVKFLNPALEHEKLVELRDFVALNPIAEHHVTSPHGVWNAVSSSIREGRRSGVYYYLSPRYFRTTTLTGSGTWNLVTAGLTGTLAGTTVSKNFPDAHAFGVPISARKLDPGNFGSLTLYVDAHGGSAETFTVRATTINRAGATLFTTDLDGTFAGADTPEWFTATVPCWADTFTFPQRPANDTNFVKFSYSGSAKFTINSICLLEDKDSF